MVPALVSLLAVGANGEVKNPRLRAGITAYTSGDYGTALGLLTQALDLQNTHRDRARIHLYIGLIQHRFNNTDDAGRSFEKGLDFDPRARLPKDAPARSRSLFRSLKQQKGLLKKPKRRKKRSVPEERAEVLEPMTATSWSRTSTRGQVRRPELEERILGAALEREQEEEAPGPWILLGTGGAAALAGGVLAAVSTVNGRGASDLTVPSEAKQQHDTAVAQRTASFVCLGVAGIAFGAAVVLAALSE